MAVELIIYSISLLYSQKYIKTDRTMKFVLFAVCFIAVIAALAEANAVPKFQPLGDKCNFDRDCGEAAMCVGHKCQCTFGFEPEADKVDCTMIRCFNDATCRAVDPHSMCSVNEHCQCAPGFNLDELVQACVPL